MAMSYPMPKGGLPPQWAAVIRTMARKAKEQFEDVWVRFTADGEMLENHEKRLKSLENKLGKLAKQIEAEKQEQPEKGE